MQKEMDSILADYTTKLQTLMDLTPTFKQETRSQSEQTLNELKVLINVPQDPELTNNIYINFRDSVLFPLVESLLAETYITIKTTFNRKEAQDLKAKETKKAELDKIKAKKTADEHPGLKSMMKPKDRPKPNPKSTQSLFSKGTEKRKKSN